MSMNYSFVEQNNTQVNVPDRWWEDGRSLNSNGVPQSSAGRDETFHGDSEQSHGTWEDGVGSLAI